MLLSLPRRPIHVLRHPHLLEAVTRDFLPQWPNDRRAVPHAQASDPDPSQAAAPRPHRPTGCYKLPPRPSGAHTTALLSR